MYRTGQVPYLINRLKTVDTLFRKTAKSRLDTDMPFARESYFSFFTNKIAYDDCNYMLNRWMNKLVFWFYNRNINFFIHL